MLFGIIFEHLYLFTHQEYIFTHCSFYLQKYLTTFEVDEISYQVTWQIEGDRISSLVVEYGADRGEWNILGR